MSSMVRKHVGRAVVGLAIASTLGVLPAAAATKDWTKTTPNADNTYAYSKVSNWSPTGSPGAADVARFNRGTSYTVTFTGAAKINRVMVGNDNLIMDLRGNSYTATSTVQPSLSLGNKANDTSRLQIKNGTLKTAQAVVGSVASSFGSVTVSTGGIWNGLGSLTVGSFGSGNLTVTSGGKASATALKLGTVGGTKGSILLSGNGSALNISGSGMVGSNPSDSSPTAGVGTFYIYTGATANFTGILDIRQGGNTVISGGTLTTGAIQNTSGGNLGFTAGVINLQKSDFLVGTLGPLGSSVTLTGSQTINVVRNTQLNSNAVLIMQGGRLTTNMIDNQGEIRFTSSGSLGAPAGVSNSGQMNFITGAARIDGDVSNISEGSVTVSGGSANFQGGVSHNGAGFSVAPSSTALFSGAVSGAGNYSGGGLLEFTSTGSYSPDGGSIVYDGGGEEAYAAARSAAIGTYPTGTIYMANTVSFDPGSTLFLDMGPYQTTDQIVDNGDVQLADVQLVIDPAFSPQMGDVYTLLLANNIEYGGSITVAGDMPLPYQINQTPTELSVSFVPEPSVAAGLCLGSMLIFGRRRRHAPDA